MFFLLYRKLLLIWTICVICHTSGALRLLPRNCLRKRTDYLRDHAMSRLTG